MNGNDELYIGWENQAPPRVGRRTRATAIFLLMLSVVTGLMLALVQSSIGVAVFEWGKIKTFTGTLRTWPYPHLVVPRPGNGVPSSYHLVAPLKFGLSRAVLEAYEGKAVTLSGTLIYRGNQTMIEARPDSFRLASQTEVAPAASVTELGFQTLIGEIVDSKCFLGVMNPGQLAPHRACAVRCISGGIPPVLLVRAKEGPPRYLLLVSEDGAPVNRQVLDMVAQPIAITGRVSRQGELLILRADPATYRRVRL